MIKSKTNYNTKNEREVEKNERFLLCHWEI